MKLKEILDKLSFETHILVKGTIIATGETFDIYRGRVENVPYSIAEEPVGYDECIEIENNILTITTGEPQRKKLIKNNQEWLDALDEKDTLLYLMGIIYHYDVGTIKYEEENFSDSHWGKLRDDMLTFCQTRLGYILSEEMMKEWYKKRELR